MKGKEILCRFRYLFSHHRLLNTCLVPAAVLEHKDELLRPILCLWELTGDRQEELVLWPLGQTGCCGSREETQPSLGAVQSWKASWKK